MKKLLALKWITVILIMAGCVAFSSCSKDDDNVSREKVKEELLQNPNDLEDAGLYGAVKTRTRLNFSRVGWENGSIVEGDTISQDVYEYEKNGYLSQRTVLLKLYYSGIYVLMPNSISKVVSRDSKYRETEYLTTFYTYDSGGNVSIALCSKRTTTYDDVAGTATVIEQLASDGVVYRDTEKRVYKLNKYGRIDYGNSEEYPVKNGFETDPSNKWVTKRDEKGNVVQQYRLSLYGSSTSISSYSRTEYVYY